MINKGLLDLINSGEAVVFVGAGASADSGLPSWPNLYKECCLSIGAFARKAEADSLADRYKFPEAFDLMSSSVTRERLHRAVVEIIERQFQPSPVHKTLTGWPARLYVTTNYDHLLEDVIPAQLTSVGNDGNEILKMDGAPRDVVWHLHGSTRLHDAQRLVLSKGDYANLYPDSNVATTLKAIFRTTRSVFVGFGFRDADMAHILATVSRLAHDARPNFAFVGYPDITSSEASQHQRGLRELNIEVIPYRVVSGSHAEVKRLLAAYSTFVVPRSVRSELRSSTHPSYEAKTSSLVVQSILDLKDLPASAINLKERLLSARVLALVASKEPVDEKTTIDGCTSHSFEADAVEEQIRRAVDSGLLAKSNGSLTTTKAFAEKKSTSIAKLELLKNQFTASLYGRTQVVTFIDELSRKKVADFVAHFFEDLCRNSGLGVAQNLFSTDVSQIKQRSVALMTDLSTRVSNLGSLDEALAAITVAIDVLTSASDSERKYLGHLCQSYFGQHLVGASSKLSEVDLGFIKGCCYILDASVLVCLLAEGSKIQEPRTQLVKDLIKLGAHLATTDLFLEEVTEHLNWALNLTSTHGEDSPEIIDALRGARHYRPNLFLQGYFLGPRTDATFASYLARLFKYSRTNKRCSEDQVAAALKALGVETVSFGGWEGFEQQLFAERDRVETEITSRRVLNGSFRRERQVKAEAEVAIVVDRIRRGLFRLPGRVHNDAFFVSSTRVVDGVSNLQTRTSISAEGLANWIWTVSGATEQHAGFVFQQLLWDLAGEGIEFIDRSTLLRKFSGVVQVAEEQLAAAISGRREYLVERFGANPEEAFRNADPLDIPRIAQQVTEATVQKLTKALQESATRESKATEAAKVSEKDRAELERLRQEKKFKRKEAKRRQRRHESKPRRKK